MKKRLVLLMLVATLATGAFAANGVLDDFEDPAAPYNPIGNGWNTDKGWSTWGVQADQGEGPSQGNVWSNGSSWYEIVTSEGISAPTAVGDWASSEARFQVTVGPNGSPQVNGYAWNFGFETEADGSGSGVEMIFSRRQDAIFGAATTGDAGWVFYGWTNISEIGLETTDDTSDWFTQRVTITKAAVGYDVLAQILDTDGETVLVERLSEGEELPTMAAAPIWYGKMATQNTVGYTDITKIVFDNYVLKNSKYTGAATSAHTPNPEDGDTEVDSTTLTQVTWEGPLPYSATDPNTEPNLVSVDQYDISYYILNNGDVTVDDPNWPDTTKVIFDDDVTSPYAISIDYEQTMFWRIDTHLTWDSNDLTGAGFTTIETGDDWMFSTKPAYIAPVVTTSDVITTVALTSGGNVAALSATVENNSDPITSVTLTLLTDDYEFPAGSDAAVSDTTTGVPGMTPTIAAELTTTMAGIYKVELVVEDGTTTIEEIIVVNVYADACKAKKDSPGGWTANYYDRDNDCDVDVADFAELALQWLNDTTMKAQEDDDFGDIFVIPQSIFAARIEGESVDPNDVSDPPIDDNPLVGIRIVNKPNATGGQLALGWGSDGAYAQYDIPVEAGTYDVWISFAANTAAPPVSFGDGTTVDAYGSITLPSTGSWETFYVLEYPGAVTFPATETVTFRVTMGAPAFDLDWFTLVKQP